MTTLRIEHPISDLSAWRQAFDSFSEARQRAGVVSHVVRQPVGDAHHLSVDLEFPDVAGAEAFRTFLRTRVWASTDASPALRGEPIATIHDVVEAT
ncbi:MAG: hypothetical protein ABI131_02560 [Nostocoides sp.]